MQAYNLRREPYPGYGSRDSTWYCWGLGLHAFKISYITTAGRTKRIFSALFGRQLVFRGADGNSLPDTEPLELARKPGEGFGVAVQLHDGMTADEAVVLLRAVLGIRSEMIETIRIPRPGPTMSQSHRDYPPGLSQSG